MQPKDLKMDSQGNNPRETLATRQLRRFMSDLGATRRPRPARDQPSGGPILGTLGDSLLHLLDLRFVFIRLHATAQGTATDDHLSIDNRFRTRMGHTNLAVELQPWLSGTSATDLSPERVRLGTEAVTLTTLSFKSKIIPSTLIFGAKRASFPTPFEALLLQAAAGEAVLALLEDRYEQTREPRELAAMLQSGSDFIGLAHASRVLSLGELTASLAHEINQPLAAIVTHADAARRWLERTPPEYDRARTALESIVRDGNRASAIIQRVRAFSTKAEPSRQPVNVNDVIREVVSFTAYEISREQVILKTDLAEDLPAVSADHIELQQVVLNLVINSIEALRPVIGRPRSLSITSARRNRTRIEVSVRDNGNGIDAQHLVRMFEPFFTTKSGGMGLGLAVSRRIIEAHKGALRAQTNPSWGLTLAFTLPVPRRRVS
jgi:signal transduction histidine kinase